MWNYEDTQLVPPYDHEYVLVVFNAQYRFTRTSLLRVTADGWKRNFGQRPSFQLDGTQPLGNPAVKYKYREYGVTARQRITRSMWFGLDYIFTTREDRHLGYNTYTKDSYGFEFHWSTRPLRTWRHPAYTRCTTTRTRSLSTIRSPVRKHWSACWEV